jgi:FtsP/CotA-like multicopper oxidase with cupredoxin domain
MQSKFLHRIFSMLIIASLLFSGNATAFAQGPNGGGGGPKHTKQGRITQADRQAAAANKQAQMQAAGVTAAPNMNMSAALSTPDYFGTTPNWALSPLPTVDPVTGAVSGGIRKFVDTLPRLCDISGVNDLGQCLPIAKADTTTYPGSDYYVIELGKYTEQLHKDLPATQLEGYRQVNTSDPYASQFNYLGPTIIAQKDRPVRVKFINNLGPNGAGDLFLPVDTTVMGAGMGPTGQMYTENRATLHLHGGTTPWISDGTQHQWTTPAGDTTAYPQGVSVQNVPDMDGGVEPQGTLTFYYTNQQSARLMFYHDHAYGITRLNVYAGQAAGYVLRDDAEAALETNGVIPGLADNIPLIIQDKTFVPDPAQLAAQDPTWDVAKFGGFGNLWFPHVYMPNQNPWDMSGANAMGRWDYGPWFWPPFTGITNGQLPNPYCLPKPPVSASDTTYDCSATPWEAPFMPGTPNPSLVPEGFMDTPLVNGTAYPVLNVDPKAYRFRVLNAANDRMWNLSLYQAGTNNPMWDATTGALLDPNAGEVPMVPANPGAATFPTDWVTATGGSGIRPDIADGRVMGLPDPNYLGPSWIQIGTEGGFLPAPVVIPPSPTGYDYNPRNVVVLNVTKHSLYLGPAERADVIVDFSAFAGKTLILYNDAPAPVPAGDPRVDYYTGGPDMTSTGGAPTVLPGYGPNTRTIMQIKVAANTPAPYNLSNLQAALPGAYAQVQPAPIVPEPQYNVPFNANYPTNFVRIQDTSTSFTNGTLGGLTIVNGGGGFTSVPTVAITGGGGAGATATAALGPTAVGSLTLVNGGSGYTSAPTITFTGGGGSGATGTATLATAGSVKSVAVNTSGSGYTAIPTVSFVGGGGSGATAVAVVSNRRVTAITVTNGGSGYTSTPTVTITGGGGTGATATATLGRAVASLALTNGGSGYTSTPNVAFSGGGGTGASATATLAGRVVASLTLTNAGSGYVSLPTVTISGGGGSGATATATMAKILMALQPKAIQELFDPDYGRMNALLGVEVPNTTGLNQTTIPYTDIDPATEIFRAVGVNDAATPIGTGVDGTQLWKITHNGVDTHAIHWHMFNVQVVNRVGWDGAVRFPDANELGWKDTVRMNPLEDIIVALRPIKPEVPWDLPNSVRPLDVTAPLNSTIGFLNVDPTGQPATVTNHLINFGWEYVWHCHLLGHEENIMMRPIIVGVAPKTPGLTLTAVSNGVQVSVADNSLNETGFTVSRATNANGPWTVVKTLPAATGAPQTFIDTNAKTKGTTYYYKVVANNVVGDTTAYAAPAIGYPDMSVDSIPATASITK